MWEEKEKMLDLTRKPIEVHPRTRATTPGADCQSNGRAPFCSPASGGHSESGRMTCAEEDPRGLPGTVSETN